ncbi:hypothetical protein AKJ16_DCAP10861 [Drosera capensis]
MEKRIGENWSGRIGNLASTTRFSLFISLSNSPPLRIPPPNFFSDSSFSFPNARTFSGCPVCPSRIRPGYAPPGEEEACERRWSRCSRDWTGLYSCYRG